MKGISQPPDLAPGPFISYAREDHGFVRKLHDALLERGRDAWVDWEIFPTTEWMREIRAAIDAAPAIIFVISPDSVASTVCRQELDHALAQHKRLIPLVCREVGADKIDESIRKLNWIYLLKLEELDEKVEQLIRAMDADLDWIRAHSRLLVRARDWEGKGQDRSLLLHGNDLKDSEQWLTKIGGNQIPRPTALQTQYVIASRKAQTLRQRYTLAGVSIALVVTAILAIYALIQSRLAAYQRDTALSRLLAAQSLKNSVDSFGHLDLALLLSVAAHQIQPTLEARNNLFSALIETNRLKKFVHTSNTLVSIAVSPDGRTIATGNFNGEIALWDAETLKARTTMEHGKGSVECLSFSPDGATLASAGTGRIVLWDALSGHELRALAGGHEYVKRLAWHPDGTTLFSGSINEPLIFFWDVATGNRRTAIRPHERGLRSFAISPDGKTIASAGEWEGGIKLWDVATRKERMVLHGHESRVRAIAFSSDGALLASGGEDAMIIIWEAASGAQRMTLKGHTDRIECLAFSHNGKRLASGGNNRGIILWDLSSGKPLELLRGHENSLSNVAFTPDDKELVSNAFDDTFIVWDLGMPRQQALLTGHQADVRTVAASPDGATLASGSDDKTIRLWDAVTGQERAVLKEHRGEIRTVAFSPDGRLLASGADDDRRIIFWEVKSGRQLQEIDGQGNITSVAFSPDGKFLASAAEGSSAIFLWEVTSGEQLAELSGHELNANGLEFSRDGKILVSGGREGAIRLWDVSTRREIAEPMGLGGSVMKVAISPDGRTVASSTDMPGTILLWDLRSNKEPDELDIGGPWGGNSIAYSPDGKTLAYTSGESRFNIVLWDIANRKPRGTLEALTTTLSMAFTPDGRRLITGHSNGDVSLWDVDIEGWPRRACEIANRNLTREEWKAFVSEDLPYRAVCPELPAPDN